MQSRAIVRWLPPLPSLGAQEGRAHWDHTHTFLIVEACKRRERGATVGGAHCELSPADAASENRGNRCRGNRRRGNREQSHAPIILSGRSRDAETLRRFAAKLSCRDPAEIPPVHRLPTTCPPTSHPEAPPEITPRSRRYHADTTPRSRRLVLLPVCRPEDTAGRRGAQALEAFSDAFACSVQIRL